MLGRETRPLRKRSGEDYVILSERSESKNLPIYGLFIRNFRAKILRLASLAQDDSVFSLVEGLGDCRASVRYSLQ